MSDKEINKAHLEAEKLSRQQFDLTLKGEAESAGVRSVSAAEGQSIHADSKEQKRQKEAETILFLDQMQRLEQEARQHLDNMRNIQGRMDDILDQRDQEIGLAKTQSNKLNNYIEAFKNKDVDQMQEFMIASGLYDQEEISAMMENGSFLHEYGQFIDDAISEYDKILQRLDEGKQKFEQLEEEYNAEKVALQDDIELANAAGNTELAEELQNELDQSKQEFDTQKIRLAEQALSVGQLDNTEIFRKAFKEHVEFSKNDPEWSKVLYETSDRTSLDKPATLSLKTDFDAVSGIEQNTSTPEFVNTTPQEAVPVINASKPGWG
ncbi:hypothetical protein [uncultured Roseivirga sp.]|uniref:hypothetical protein n=1 Tax=uncultured Roseivirga sp. TaxID=543088 RepID=UPI0030D94F80